MTTQQPPPIHTGYGIVKQVNSGDCVVIRGQPKGGPPDEIVIILTGIQAPKLARRLPDETTTKDEPFAWEAREFLRKKLIGKRVFFSYEKSKQSTETPKSGRQTREYGIVYNGLDASAENVAESLVSEGLAGVRGRGNEYVQKLRELEDNARASGKGKHALHINDHVRDIRWSVEDPNNFKDSFHQKPLKAIVEHVVDGSTLRVLLYSENFPEYYYVKLMLSGIRCPGCDDKIKGPEPFSEEAKFFTESRLLQRDVEVLLEGVSNKNFLGTILHPKGNITELLLSEGWAKCVDWSIQCVTGGPEKLRAAEKLAKEKRLRIWKDYMPSGPIIDAKEKEFQGKVVEIINADAMVIKLADGSTKKIFLASLRPPRLPENSPDTGKARPRPLYDVPYMFDAREFLRKKLIGKKVQVTVDYKQAANANFPEKTCCTVTIGGINVAEALISKGLATVVRYRADDDQRSAHYDDLLSAETKAIKSMKGLHSKKEVPSLRIVDLSGDLKSSKQYFPIIQRGGKMEAIVEFVVSGSRLRVFLPRQNYLLTFLIGGITCARASRDTPAGRVEGDPYGDQALAYTKDLCLQRQVQIEVESMDKAGSFIGWLWVENLNLSEALVREGFAEVHSVAARSPYYRALQAAQEEAQNKKIKMWENWKPIELEPKQDLSDRTFKYIKVQVTESRVDFTTEELVLFTQHFDEAPKIEEMMAELRDELQRRPPIPGECLPQNGDYCVARYSDDQWYRAKVSKVVNQVARLRFIDYGQDCDIPVKELGILHTKYHTPRTFIHQYALAFVKIPREDDIVEEARFFFNDACAEYDYLLLNIEYTVGLVNYVTVVTDGKKDLGKLLVENGLALIDKKRTEKKFKKILEEYKASQEIALKGHVGIWRYGDITEDDAKEFG